MPSVAAPAAAPSAAATPAAAPSYVADGPVAAAEGLVLAAWAPKGSPLMVSFAKKRAEAPAGEEKGKGKKEKKKHKAAEAPLVRQCRAHGSPVPCQACSTRCSSADVKKPCSTLMMIRACRASCRRPCRLLRSRAWRPPQAPPQPLEEVRPSQA